VIELKRNDDDIEIIKNIIKNPEKYYKKTYIDKNIKAVNLIEELPNIFPN
jgi:hypothetical protein